MGRKEDTIAFHVDPSMDLALQASRTQLHKSSSYPEHFETVNWHFIGVLTFSQALLISQLQPKTNTRRSEMLNWPNKIFPLCECFLLIDHSVESSSQFKNGLVKHAFAAADSTNAVRSLLEKMTELIKYLSILERWVYEGTIDDPYGDFFASIELASLIKDKFLTLDLRNCLALIRVAFSYVAPEYANSGLLNEKSDVYSFGPGLYSWKPMSFSACVSDNVQDVCGSDGNWKCWWTTDFSRLTTESYKQHLKYNGTS
ncbi:unnamed protein product [Arabis nemorensis]|uniref:Uncharacterized protein n=1 Tax=Arabis nemorensis TaxID=586526 RepID=A0A565CN73_9BRAS|nr:unnamed protein product [Arabis nemorensis]